MSVLQRLRVIGCGVSLCALGLGCGGGSLAREGTPTEDELAFADGGKLAGNDGKDLCGNGLDDDGNGQIDDGCACTRGETQRCFGGDPRLAGVGPCVYGTQRCVGDQEFPAWGACGGFGQPRAERCGNQLDDDCDGTADEGCSSNEPACSPDARRACSSALGAGTQTCVNNAWTACAVTACENGATNPPSCNSRTVDCPPLPAQALRNTAQAIAQQWGGDTWLPTATLTHNPTPSTTECRFTCKPTLSWNGSACVATYVAHATSRCVNPASPTNQSAMDWYWFDSLNARQELRAACQAAPGAAINCSDLDGCCTPQGVAINGRCVPYAKQGERCYANNQCVAPLVCNAAGVCAEGCKPSGSEPTKSGSLIGLPFTHCITDPEEEKGLFVGRSIRPEDTDLYFFVANSAKQCCSQRLRVLDHTVGQPPCNLGMWLLRCE